MLDIDYAVIFLQKDIQTSQVECFMATEIHHRRSPISLMKPDLLETLKFA